MPRWSRATLIAGAFCAQVIASACAVNADTTADAIRDANAAIAVPTPAAMPPDPCAGRAWTFAHPLRFCGPIRLVPADPVERDLWWGEHVSELADAYFSAAGQHALFANRQVVAGTLRGRAWTMANLQGLASPAQAEANPFVRPFAAGGIGGYLLGFFAIDVGQGVIGHLPRSLGMRPLSALSRRSILGQDIAEHVDGAQSWVPVLREGRHVNAITQWCTAAAQRVLTDDQRLGSVPAPKRCASIWPAITPP